MQQRDGEIQELHWVSNLFIPMSGKWLGKQPQLIIEFSGSIPQSWDARLVPFRLICSVFTLFDIRDHEEPGCKALWHLLANGPTQWHSIVKGMNTQFWTLLLLPGTTREMLHTFSLSRVPYPRRNICPNGCGALGSCILLKITGNYTAQLQSSIWNGDSALKHLDCGGSHPT